MPAEKRAKEASAFIASEVNLNQEDSDFTYTVLLEKMTSTAEQINGKNLSKEEKKAIYGASHKETSKRLSAHFSADKVKEIFAAFREYMANSKKK